MLKTLIKSMRLLFLSTSMGLLSPLPARAYQVDCAILLCLSGGWPASAPCAHARAVFIRRITPWPIEPPLQIWRCPMQAAMHSAPGESPAERLFNFAFSDAPLQSVPGELDPNEALTFPAIERSNDRKHGAPAALLHLAQQISTDNGTADIDISGPEFDFVRSIKVWNVMHYSHVSRGGEGGCEEDSRITLGTYGAQGEFGWRPSGPGPVPTWVIPTRVCRSGNYVRAVGIEWTDYEGNHGYELVRY